MRRVQKFLLGVFLGGVLLGGIGTGVAFVEYSSITYAGEKKIGQESLVTEEFDFAFQPEEGGVMVVSRRYSDGQSCVLEEDASVPENMVRYQVTYNPDTVTPELVFHENEAESDQQQGDPENIKYQGELELDTWYHEDSFALWMENKDEILRDLKQGMLASYRVDYVTAVKIKVNPQTMQYIKKVN